MPSQSAVASHSAQAVAFDHGEFRQAVQLSAESWVEYGGLPMSSLARGDILVVSLALMGQGMYALSLVDSLGDTTMVGRAIFFGTDEWLHVDIRFENAVPRGRLRALRLDAIGQNASLCLAGLTVDLVRRTIDVPAVPWCMVSDDVDLDGAHELVYGSLGHDSVFCVSLSGAVEWVFACGGIARDIALGDIEHDHGVETAVITGDTAHTLHVLAANGARLWHREFGDLVIQAVATGDIDGDGSAEVLAVGQEPRVHVFRSDGQEEYYSPITVARTWYMDMACGDVDGDGIDDIALASLWDHGVHVYNYRGDRLVATEQSCAERVLDRASSVCLANLDSDPALEIVAGSTNYARTAAFDHDGSLLWSRATLETKAQSSVVHAGDFTADPGDEIAVFSWADRHMSYEHHEPALRLLSADGAELSMLLRDHAFATACVLAEGAADRIALAGDFDALDRKVVLLNAEELAHESMREPLSNSRCEAPAYAELLREVRHAPRRPKTGAGAFTVLLSRYLLQDCSNWPHCTYRTELIDSFVSENVDAAMVWENVREDSPTLNPDYGTLVSRDSILSQATRFEYDGLPFYMELSHCARLFLTLETCSLLTRAAPTQFRGFVCLEDFGGYRDRDCRDDSNCWQRYVEMLSALMPLCRTSGLKVIICDTKEGPRVAFSDTACGLAGLLLPENADVIVPMMKLNNQPSADKTLSFLIGLWREGLVSDFGYSTQYDNWNWQQVRPAGAAPDDLVLRMDIIAAASGARFLRVEGSQKYAVPIRQQDTEEPVLRFAGGSENHRGLVYELLRRNILEPIEPGQLVNVNPVRIEQVHRDLLVDGPRELARAKQHWALGDGHQLDAVPQENIGSYLYGCRYHGESVFPRPKHGLVYIIPEGTSRVDDGNCVVTDGEQFMVDGECVDAAEARDIVAQEFQLAARRVPFTTADCVLFAHDLGDRYRLVLVHPGYFGVGNLECTVRVNLPMLESAAAVDVLTGDEFRVRHGILTTNLQAGLFRMLEIAKPAGGRRESVAAPVLEPIPVEAARQPERVAEGPSLTPVYTTVAVEAAQVANMPLNVRVHAFWVAGENRARKAGAESSRQRRAKTSPAARGGCAE